MWLIYGGHFDIDFKKEEIKKLQSQTEQEGFWNDREQAENILREMNEKKSLVDQVEGMKSKIIRIRTRWNSRTTIRTRYYNYRKRSRRIKLITTT